jgi:phosphotransferase system  glucose/maltose/N-acetylglucosamine-specific IIC component
MNIFEFVAGLVAILAWPAAVVAMVFIIKREMKKQAKAVTNGNARAFALRDRVRANADEDN